MKKSYTWWSHEIPQFPAMTLKHKTASSFTVIDHETTLWHHHSKFHKEVVFSRFTTAVNDETQLARMRSLPIKRLIGLICSEISENCCRFPVCQCRDIRLFIIKKTSSATACLSSCGSYLSVSAHFRWYFSYERCLARLSRTVILTTLTERSSSFAEHSRIA